MTYLKNPFSRPLDSWNNPDLMIAEARRAEVCEKLPWAGKLFDWPELRSVFLEQDTVANKYRRRVRGQGYFAILSAVAGLVLAALLPIIGNGQNTLSLWLGGIASTLAVFGGFAGFEHLWRGSFKTKWLHARLITERLRHLYFQIILRHLGELLHPQHPMPQENWNDVRGQELERFSQDFLADPQTALKQIERDILDEGTWLYSEPDQNLKHGDLNENLSELLTFFQMQRLDIQRDYISEKIERDPLSPSRWTAVLRPIVNLLAGLLFLSAFVIGALYFTRADINDGVLIWCLALQATGTAILTGLRVLDEGHRFTEEKDLYSWYAAKVTKLHKAYQTADQDEKLGILIDLEQTSYEEFRRFFLAHDRATFLL